MKQLLGIQRSVFSLIELYVVIFVIGVLISLLMPALRSSKTSSMVSVCSYNLRTIGIALSMYETAYELYPIDDPLVARLYSEEFLKNPRAYRCPVDSTAEGDTYSYGYIGGHPSVVKEDDPLVVCGWHRRVGSLAVYEDASVGDLNGRKNTNTLPVTITQGENSVDPRFMLHDSDSIVVKGADGEEAYIYGKDGAYYLAASYDPYAGSGKGMFTIAVGFDPESKVDQKYNAKTPYSYMKFHSKLKYANVEVTSDPEAGGTYFTWEPLGDKNQINITNYAGYRISHRITGQFDETEDPNNKVQFETTVKTLTMQDE